MIPSIVLERLAAVRRKEKNVRVAWGAARAAGVVVAALLAACLLDWIVDRNTDTPFGLRALLLLAQLGLAGWTAWTWVIQPAMEGWSDRDVALWAEERFPELGHRLISAVQLNVEGAPVKGMSPELIAAVTKQAEESARSTDFAAKVLFNRGLRADAVTGLAVLAALILGASSPSTAGALLARQVLLDRDVPRSVSLAAEKPERVAPSGEELTLRFKASGASLPDAGVVRLDPEGRPSESYALTKGEGDVYTAKIPPAAVNFAYRAWLGDGRTRKPARVAYEPRPVVKRVEAALLLPAYVGERPDGARYEQPRPRGEVAGPKGSSARVVVEIQKPVVKAGLELLARTGPEAGEPPTTRRVEMSIDPSGLKATASFDLREDEGSYRVAVEDKNGFANTAPPRRGAVVVPDEPPKVVLLPERFVMPGEEQPSEDSEIEGAPIPLGSAIRVAWYASHPYGLSKARLAWRVIKAGQSADGASAAPADWKRLPLGEVRETAESGPFDARRGVFKNSGFRDQVEFHPLPTPDAMLTPGGLEAGGCFDFQTRAIPGLAPGDQVEIRIEVFARNPELGDRPGVSESRLKAFVTQPQFVDWVIQTLRHESRLRQLEARQKGVFAPEGADR